MTKLLIAEDDPSISMLEQDYLELEGFEVTVVGNGQLAVTEALTGQYALILLDLMLPGCNGYDVCRLIRDKVDVPILMVTARTELVDKIRGLGLGADDYIAKPFGIMEFLARVRALLRRGEPREMITVRAVTLYPAARRVESSGQDVQLTAKEFNLLEYLMRRAGTVIRREELLEAVWGYSGGEETRTVDVHIRSLRLKLGEEGGTVIKTVRGVGYMAEEA